ncbi:MAG: SIR2 family protein [Frankiaceae bacterium]
MTDQLLAPSRLLLPEGRRTEEQYMRQVFLQVRDLLRQWFASQGRSDPIDVETIMDAALRLATRDEDDIAPFVAQWSAGVREPRWYGIQRPALRAVAALVQLGPAADLGYLTPLFDLTFRQGGLTVATLNYDRTVEEAAWRSGKGVAVETGFTEWFGNPRLTFTDDSLRLLKLHGSADWVHVILSGMAHGGSGGDQFYSSSPPETLLNQADDDEPGIIFGGRSKLRAEGPYLRLYQEFTEELERASRLVVVGYSFRDQHINHLIRNFVRRRGDVVVVDPFRSPELEQRIRITHDRYQPPVRFIEASVAAGLGDALFRPVTELPEVEP